MSDKAWSVVICALLVIGVLALVVGVTWIQAYNESRTYNRLTGARTTTWDALWVELRVQGEPVQ